MSEPEAFRWIQKASMDRRMSMREVATVIIADAAGYRGQLRRLGRPPTRPEPLTCAFRHLGRPWGTKITKRIRVVQPLPKLPLRCARHSVRFRETNLMGD